MKGVAHGLLSVMMDCDSIFSTEAAQRQQFPGVSWKTSLRRDLPEWLNAHV